MTTSSHCLVNLDRPADRTSAVILVTGLTLGPRLNESGDRTTAALAGRFSRDVRIARDPTCSKPPLREA